MRFYPLPHFYQYGQYLFVPATAQMQADRARTLFSHKYGDHLTMLNAYHEHCSPEAQEILNYWCRENFPDFGALQLAEEARKELHRIMKNEQIDLISTPFEDKAYYTNIRRAIVTGFFMQVAKNKVGQANADSYITVWEINRF